MQMPLDLRLVWLSLTTTIMVLVGLGKLTAPAETRGAMPAAVTTK